VKVVYQTGVNELSCIHLIVFIHRPLSPLGRAVLDDRRHERRRCLESCKIRMGLGGSGLPLKGVRLPGTAYAVANRINDLLRMEEQVLVTNDDPRHTTFVILPVPHGP
jgi:hypothetical protein